MADLPYKTLDQYPDLAPVVMNSARVLEFKAAPPNTTTWEYIANILSIASPGTNDLFKLSFIKGASYSFISYSFFGSSMLVYDEYGNAVTTGGFSFIAPYTGTFYVMAGWNPGAYYNDVYLFVYEDRDTIRINTAPYIGDVLKAITWAEGAQNQYALPSGAFLDPADTLTYSATLSSGAALPIWLTFNATTHAFSGNPPAGSADVVVTITVKDTEGLSVSQNLTIATNQAPIAAIPLPSLSWTEGAVGAYSLPSTAFSDPDGSALTLSAKIADGSALPGWLSFLPSNRLLAGTPPTGTADLRITVTATDAGGLTASSTFTLATPGAAKDVLPMAAMAILRDAATDQVTALISQVTNGAMTSQAAINLIVAKADATTSVATLNYQFFTGKIPGEAGIDYLVSATGPNANNLNSAYYQSFNLENRYINFAVNLGTAGEGKAKFQTEYGTLTLEQATKKAYGVIFGAQPTDAKVAALLGGGRDAYLEAFGRDGHNGAGTKAAMVGWLLAEAEKADIGVYARSNAAFLTDISDGGSWAVDLVGVYGRPDFVYVA